MVTKQNLFQIFFLVLIRTSILIAIPTCQVINESLCKQNKCKFNRTNQDIVIRFDELGHVSIYCKTGTGNLTRNGERVLNCSAAKHFGIENCDLGDIHDLVGNMNLNSLKKLELIRVRLKNNYSFPFPVDKLEIFELFGMENMYKKILQPMRNLNDLDISESIVEMTEDFLENNRMLKVLNLARNTLSFSDSGLVNSSNKVPENLLRNNVNLEIFSWISDPEPRSFPEKFFDHLFKLHTFRYGTSDVGTPVNFDGDLPTSLRSLKLGTLKASADQIGRIVQKLPLLETMELYKPGFDLTDELFFLLKGSALKNFSFDEDSKVSCESCEFLGFDGFKGTCIYGNKSYNLPSERENLLERFCTSNNMYLAVTLVTVGFVVAIVVTILFLNERIRVSLYHRRFFAVFFKLETQDDKRFDAYISYADEDLDLVRKICSRLEKRCDHEESSKSINRQFNFCIRDRDWDIGVPRDRNLTDSLGQSRLIIFLLSKHFIASSFMQEFDMAFGQNKILVIMRITEDGKECQVTPNDLNNVRLQSLKLFLKTFPYLREDDGDFWRKLVYRLPHKKMLTREKSCKIEDTVRQNGEIVALIP